MNGSFLVYGDMMVAAPDRRSVEGRGWNLVEDAYAHAVWSEGWRTLTGRSWEQWEADEAARREHWYPKSAQLEVTLDKDTSMLTDARVVSPGVLHLSRFRTKAEKSDSPMVSMRMSMRNVTIRTR